MKKINLKIYISLHLLLLIIGFFLFPITEMKYLSIILILFACNFYYFYKLVYYITNNSVGHSSFLPTFGLKMLFLFLAVGIAVFGGRNILLKVGILYIFQLIILLLSIKNSVQKN